jgi:hypothetical protein
MIVCLPTESQAGRYISALGDFVAELQTTGTIITNFAGPFRLADEISTNCTRGIIDDHPLERASLGCVWIVSFAMLRMMAEQLNFAFEIFDPTEIADNVREALFVCLIMAS